MRHRKKINHLSRKTAHRKAMLSNMANSLIMHKRIQTTVAKAKALRIFVEPLITKSKTDTTHSRRVVFSYLKDKHAVSELFRDVSAKVADRPGGYTRIIKTGYRLGDNAEMCIIELVDYNENLLGKKVEEKAKTTRRSRRGGSKKKSTETPTENSVVKENLEEKKQKSNDAVKDEAVVEEKIVGEKKTEELIAEEAEPEDIKSEDNKAEKEDNDSSTEK